MKVLLKLKFKSKYYAQYFSPNLDSSCCSVVRIQNGCNIHHFGSDKISHQGVL